MKSAIFLIISLLFLSSCTDTLKNENYDRKEADQIIQIHYKFGFADEINTFTKTYIKDLVLDGTLTIDFWFQREDQDTILKVVEEINFFNLPDTLSYYPEDSIAVAINPDPGIQSLRIKYGSQDKTVYWYLINSFPTEYYRINRITGLIKEILYADPEYQSLPEPTGGYD